MTDNNILRPDVASEIRAVTKPSQPSVPEHAENLKRYAHLVWRIHRRRLSDSIDRKAGAR